MTSQTSCPNSRLRSLDILDDGAVQPSDRKIHIRVNPATFSLVMLFQITTACALFFACLRISPLTAILLTLLFAPAVVRTGQISDIHRQNRMEFGLTRRIHCFLSSIVVVTFTAVFALLVFVLVSLCFGLLGMIFCTVVGSSDLTIDAAIVGTAGGMIWGFAAAMLATGFAMIRIWLPRKLVELQM